MIRVRLEKWRKIKSKNFGFFEDQELVAVMDYLRSIGKTAVRLAIDKGNPQSTHFWTKNGFEVIAEADVRPEYRKQGLASAMITFAEKYCKERYALHKYELLTGKKNTVAQSVYDKLGYKDDHEIHMSKRV